jgi:hypothetical protein
VELTKQPLANPATASQKDFENFIINAANKPTNKPLFKKPTNAEVAAFIVPYQQKDYHSGNTGFYYEFGTRKQDFILTGLHGCTAAVIVVSSTKSLGFKHNLTKSEESSRNLGTSHLGVGVSAEPSCRLSRAGSQLRAGREVRGGAAERP